MIISTLVVPVIEEEFVETTHDDNEVEGADEESNNGKICAAQVASWASDNGCSFLRLARLRSRRNIR